MRYFLLIFFIIPLLFSCEEYSSSQNRELLLFNGDLNVAKVVTPPISGQDRVVFYLIQTKDKNGSNVACDELTDANKSEELFEDPLYITSYKVSPTDPTITARVKDLYDGDYRMLLEIYNESGVKLTSKCKTIVIDSTTTTDISF